MWTQDPVAKKLPFSLVETEPITCLGIKCGVIIRRDTLFCDDGQEEQLAGEGCTAGELSRSIRPTLAGKYFPGTTSFTRGNLGSCVG